jgi:hypothetical protein
MEPGKFDLSLSPGASYRHKFIFTDGTSAIDFTGVEVRAEVRPAPASPTLYISINETPSADGYIIIDGPLGEIDIFISADATERLRDVRKAAWDMFIEWPNGEDVDKALKGRVLIDPSVTDPTYD